MCVDIDCGRRTENAGQRGRVMFARRVFGEVQMTSSVEQLGDTVAYARLLAASFARVSDAAGRVAVFFHSLPFLGDSGIGGAAACDLSVMPVVVRSIGAWGDWSHARPFFDRYMNEGALTDPSYAAVMGKVAQHASRPAGAAVSYRRVDLVDDETWHGHRHVQEVRTPARLGDIMFGAVSGGPGNTLYGCTCHRFINQPDFSAEDAEQFRISLMFAVPLFEAASRVAVAEGLVGALQPRLRTTLALLQRGSSEKQAAIHMNISPHTVHEYVKQIHRTFGVRSRGELLSKCVELNIKLDPVAEPSMPGLEFEIK